jgi:hypothetical protein
MANGFVIWLAGLRTQRFITLNNHLFGLTDDACFLCLPRMDRNFQLGKQINIVYFCSLGEPLFISTFF